MIRKTLAEDGKANDYATTDVRGGVRAWLRGPEVF